MKKYFIVAYLILFSICSKSIKAQTLSIAQLISLKNYDFGRIDEYLSGKQFEFKGKRGIGKGINSDFLFIIYEWTGLKNSKSPSKAIEAHFCYNIDGTLEEKPDDIEFTVFDFKAYNSLKQQMMQLGFKYVGSNDEKDDDGNTIIQRLYFNGKVGIEITTFVNGQWCFDIICTKSMYDVHKGVIHTN